jgi:hypothetical protein
MMNAGSFLPVAALAAFFGCAACAQTEPAPTGEGNASAASSYGPVGQNSVLSMTRSAPLRSGPSPIAAELVTVPAGAEVRTILSLPSFGYYDVSYMEGSGWMWGGFVAFVRTDPLPDAPADPEADAPDEPDGRPGPAGPASP